MEGTIKVHFWIMYHHHHHHRLYNPEWTLTSSLNTYNTNIKERNKLNLHIQRKDVERPLRSSTLSN